MSDASLPPAHITRKAMEHPIFEFDVNDPTLNVYIRYSELPVAQYVSILSSIKGIHDEVAHILIEGSTDAYGIFFGKKEDIPVLTIESIHTGNSIDIDFGSLGSFSVEDLPKWLRYLVISGMLIAGAQELQGRYLDNQRRKAEIENLQLQNEELRRKLNGENLERLDDQSNPRVQRLQMHLHSLASELAVGNIDYAEINGVAIKRDENDGEAPEERDEELMM